MQTEKKRAVAYIRVSSKKAEQIHSFDFQERYWKNALENDDSVELTEIYADKGISGCSIYKLIGIIYDKFGEEAKIVRTGENTLVASVDVQISPTFFGWLFQFSNRMKVLSPEKIMKEYKQLIEEVLHE